MPTEEYPVGGHLQNVSDKPHVEAVAFSVD